MSSFPQPGNRLRSQRGLSLLELLLVGTLFGVLLIILVPDCRRTTEFPPETIVLTDMSTLQAAFRRCYQDCQLQDEDMELFDRFGLWPLAGIAAPATSQPAPGTNSQEEIFSAPVPERPAALRESDLADFRDLLATRLAVRDPKSPGPGNNRNWRGWNGPYLTLDATGTFETAPGSSGQKTEREMGGAFTTARTLPVKPDAWTLLDDPLARKVTSWYRVIIPADPDGIHYYPGLITLVATGPNGKLDTRPTDIDPVTRELKAQGDDIVLTLLPRTEKN
ncbi:hypothetical protein OPIT5_13620 [Opitutaceae bacterium TAV5]|nr:hypothetical protein OPIT5_13620 [Opitutaceae bacterium TAV5]